MKQVCLFKIKIVWSSHREIVRGNPLGMKGRAKAIILSLAFVVQCLLRNILIQNIPKREYFLMFFAYLKHMTEIFL